MFSCVSQRLMLLCSLCFPLVRSLVCNDEIYGNPKVDDCERALLELSYARQSDGSYRFRVSHIFAEPQFLEPPFNLITNSYRPRAIIQLPKIWKHSKSRSQILQSLPPINN